MTTFSQLKKNLKNDFSNLRRIKVALLGDSATQLLSIALRGTGFDVGFDLQIWEAHFNQIERQIFDPASELYEFNPEVVIVFQSSHKLLEKYNKLIPEEYNNLAEKRLEQIGSFCAAINAKLIAKVIYYNYPEIDDAIFGNYANKTPSSFIFQLRKLNYELMLYAEKNPGFYICDLSSIQNQIGKAALFQPSMYINTEIVLGIDVLPLVALRTTEILGAMYGKIKKCLVFDLDNTIWGGTIGDDGLENIQLGPLGIGKAFTELQYWIKKLKNRGIILAVCSKNTELIAKEPFEKHPDMVLRLDDIAVFVANWDNKVDNIRQMQNTLNIGFDSMVYLDDNPFERNMVREHIPSLTIPELPEDPADFLEYLYGLNLFETASLSDEDAERTERYQTAAKRHIEQQKHVDVDAFLESLDMVSVVEPFNQFNTPRVAQLTQRSNQFNLRTIRYGVPDIEKLSSSSDHYNFTFTLKDKFGDNGLICVVILYKQSRETLFIDTWLMSCRVLKRGMENFVLNTIAGFAKEQGFNTLKGEYLPTAKNGIVKNHYEELGFCEKGDFWMLNVDTYKPKKSYIAKGDE
jgi:FkbH-like protein